jgi:hypothetical protein
LKFSYVIAPDAEDRLLFANKDDPQNPAITEPATQAIAGYAIDYTTAKYVDTITDTISTLGGAVVLDFDPDVAGYA